MKEETTRMADALSLLQSRRSPNIPDFKEPGPTDAELQTLLTIATRVPDHGKLVPWRLIVLPKARRAAMEKSVVECFRKEHPQATPDQIEKERARFVGSPLIIAVVSRAGEHVKIPEWEQILSAGAVCMNLVTAAHALGYGANWLTGWLAYDQSCTDLLGIGPNERVAGIIHIGTPGGPREDRDRPKLADIVTTL
jgi:nitroreductase